jgi:hypothetical protein
LTEPIEPAPGPFQAVEPEPSTPPAAATSKPAGAAVPGNRPRGGQGLWLNVALGIALAVALGGVAFAAGRMTAPAAAAALNGTGNGRFGNGGYFPGGGGAVPGGQGNRGFGGGASVQGTVSAVAADSITITTATGQSVTIATSGTTTYHQEASGSAADVKTGGTVIVRLGTPTPGASATATGPTANDITVVP